MKRKESSAGLGIGSTSLLMIFIILCLVVFSVLSLVSAQADSRLSDKLAERTQAWYDACSEAEEKLAEIDRLLADNYSEAAGNEASYLALCENTLEEMDVLAGTDPLTGSFTVPMQDSSLLEVSFTVSWPQETGETYLAVTSWTTGQSEEWEGEHDANLLS